jgi:opacity protein-like surface antigen
LPQQRCTDGDPHKIWQRAQASLLRQCHIGDVARRLRQVGAATYTGASIGGGGEYAFTPNVIGRAEYLYDDYRMSSSLIALHDYTAKLQNVSTVRGALSIKLN